MKHEDVLTAFVQTEDWHSSEQMTARIDACTDISMLNAYRSDSKLSSELREYANTQLVKKIDRILSTIIDITYLAELLTSQYGLWQQSAKVISRMESLWMQQSLEALIAFKDGLPSRVHENSLIVKCLDHCIAKKVVDSDHKGTFSFLIEVWQKFSPQHGLACKEVEALMPEALSKEHDLSYLSKCYAKTRRKWDGNRNDASGHITARIIEIVVEHLPTVTDRTTIDLYSRLTQHTRCSEKIDARLKTIALEEVKMMKFDQIIAYHKTISLDTYPETYTALVTYIDEILPGVLQHMDSAEELLPYIKIPHYYNSHVLLKFSKKAHVVIERFRLLAPLYFENHPSIATAVSWFNGTPQKIDEILETILLGMIPKEQDPSQLMLLSSIKNKEIIALAETQFRKLVFQMTASNEWFEKCIHDNNFFNAKEVFLQKAKEFLG